MDTPFDAGSGFGYIPVAEVELRAAVGGADLTSPADATTRAVSSGWTGGFTPDKAFNDVPGEDSWAAPRHQAPAWIGWDFGAGSEVHVAGVTIAAKASQDAADQAPGSFSLQHSEDGVTWVSVWHTGSLPRWAGSEVRAFSG